MRNSKSNLYIPYIPLTCNSKKKTVSLQTEYIVGKSSNL